MAAASERKAAAPAKPAGIKGLVGKLCEFKLAHDRGVFNAHVGEVDLPMIHIEGRWWNVNQFEWIAPRKEV